MDIKNIILILVLGLIIILSAQNTQSVQMEVLFWDISISLIVLIYLSLVIGFISGITYTGIKRITSRSARKEKDEKKAKIKKDKKEKKEPEDRIEHYSK